MKYYPLLLAVVLLFFTSCKKDSASKKDMLTKGPWLYQSGGLDLGKDGNVDFTFESIGFPTCLLDNKGTFHTDGSGVNDEGATKCDPMLPQTTAFTWAFANNETQLAITGNAFAGLSGNLSIKTLTDTQLSLTKDTTISGFPASVLINLKH